MKNRFVAALLFLALLVVPHTSHSQALPAGAAAKFSWEPLWMRSTSAASVAQVTDWSFGGPGGVPGFADSVVFRRSASATNRDTSAAYPSSRFLWPPKIGGGNASGVALSDTTLHAPWISVRVKQDTLLYSWSGGTAMDSLFFAVQWSPNGTNWISVNAAPTRAYETTNGGADENGLVPVLIGPYGEPAAGADVATAYLGCVASIAPVNSSYNINQTLCLCEGWIRFIFVFDGTGQFKPEIGSWKIDS